MKIVVCMKQVPRLDEVRFDRANRIVREDVSVMTNPLDLQALAHALRLRDQEGGEVVALTMGPPQAREMLEDAIGRGADRAIHLADKRFAGSDTLATARAIAHTLTREEPDLVLFGRSTLDGATGQVGPQVAELADLPHLTQVFELELDGRTVQARSGDRARVGELDASSFRPWSASNVDRTRQAPSRGTITRWRSSALKRSAARRVSTGPGARRPSSRRSVSSRSSAGSSGSRT